MTYKNCIENWRNIGSAATLVDKQKLLFIFVNDNDNKNDWTNGLRNPVEEKVVNGLRWLKAEADKRKIPLNIEHKCIPQSSIAIACTVSMQINEEDYKAGPHHSTWQNCVVKQLIKQKVSVSNGWRDLFKISGLPLSDTEGSAVFFCVRKHAKSVAFPFFKEENIEFEKERGIIYDSYGQKGQTYLDSLIVHEILHLYGAKDLARNTPKCLKKYGEQYPDDVMHTSTQKSLKNYYISDLTAYLIGWKNIAPSLTDFTC